MFFFFNDTATTEIYTLSLHDALPICPAVDGDEGPGLEVNHGIDAGSPGPGDCWEGVTPNIVGGDEVRVITPRGTDSDRKSTRLNSSHANISYAVFCLKKKNINTHEIY